MKNNNIFNKSSVLWLLFTLTVVLHVIDVITNVLGGSTSYFFEILKMYLPVILLFLHISWTLTYSRGIFFLLLAAVTGFVLEVIGLQYSIFFGGDYVYQLQNFDSILFDVPLLVPIYWAVFIYTGYAVSNSFLEWTGRSKPAKNKNNFAILPLLTTFDGLLVVAIDIFMNPLSANIGSWVWSDGGPYFGIPIGNFVGWFIVTVIVTGIFRIFEYLMPQKINKMKESIMLIPVLGYGLLCLVFFFGAISIKMYDLALIGLFAMVPVVVINLILFFSKKSFNTR